MSKDEFIEKIKEIEETFYRFEPNIIDSKIFNINIYLLQSISCLLEIFSGREDIINEDNIIELLYKEMKYDEENKNHFYDRLIVLITYILERKGLRCGYMCEKEYAKKILALTNKYDFTKRFNDYTYEDIEKKYPNITLCFDNLNYIIEVILNLKENGVYDDDRNYWNLIEGIFYTDNNKRIGNTFDISYEIICMIFKNENFPKLNKDDDEYDNN